MGECAAGEGCVARTLEDGAPCEDGDRCTLGELCADGACAGGQARDCAGLDGACADGQCDAMTGECVAAPAREGEICGPTDDPCMAPQCRAGACAPPGPVSCAHLDGACVTGACSPGVGCEATAVSICSLCRGAAGLCDGAGVCLEFGPGATLAEDFEGGGLPAGWRGAGDRPWASTNGQAFSGARSLRSGDIGAGDTSGAQVDVDVPDGATLRFRYRVSSEGNFDFLRVRVDAAEVLAVSGERDWTLHEAPLAPGAHTLTFEYAKDDSLDSGDDAAWIDAFEVERGCPGSACTQGRRVDADTCLTCPLPDATPCPDDSACTAGACAEGACAQQPTNECGDCGPGLSRCVAGACDDFNAVFAGFDAGDLPAPFVVGGDRPWVRVAGTAREGAGSAASGDIGHSEESTLTLQVELIEAGTVSFWYRTSTETNYDFLYFDADGERRVDLAGVHDWAFHESALAAGPHSLVWQYAKDGSVDQGDDRVWIDEVAVGTPPVCWP